MAERMRYVIAYDVRDDGNRLRLSNLLLDHGDRVQKSVFEADLSREELKGVLRRAAKLIQAEDSLRVYPLCARCRRETAAAGKRTAPVLEGCVIV